MIANRLINYDASISWDPHLSWVLHIFSLGTFSSVTPTTYLKALVTGSSRPKVTRWPSSSHPQQGARSCIRAMKTAPRSFPSIC